MLFIIQILFIVLSNFFCLACPLVGQVITLGISSCPQDCFRPGNESCAQLCAGCACAPPTIADHITGECVQPEQCTGKLYLLYIAIIHAFMLSCIFFVFLIFHLACPIEGQVYTECGSSCPRTCDNYNDTIGCTADCWQGCECPSGMVIDVERRRCVEPSQCIRELPTITTRTSENGQCKQDFTCPFNAPQNDHNICQYILEVTEVFKGNNQVCRNFSSCFYKFYA